MNQTARHLLLHDVLSIEDVAKLLDISVFAAAKRSERNGWDYVLKGRMRLYWRRDFLAADLPTIAAGDRPQAG